jgi:hypothetical protein
MKTPKNEAMPVQMPLRKCFERKLERLLYYLVKGLKGWFHSGDGSSRRSVMMAHFGPQKLFLGPHHDHSML